MILKGAWRAFGRSVGRRRGVDLHGHRHGLGAFVALVAAPDEPAHGRVLPGVTTATHPARGAAGPSRPSARPRAGSSTRRHCSSCPPGAARAGRRHRLGRGRSSDRRCHPARRAIVRSRGGQHGPGRPATHRTCQGSAAPRMGALGSAGTESSLPSHPFLELPRRERTSIVRQCNLRP